MSDDNLVPRVIDLCKSLGIRARRCQSGRVKVGRYWMQLGDESWPDVIGYAPDGRFVGIECKAAGAMKKNGTRHNERVERQRAFLEELNGAGGIGIIGDSYEQIREELIEKLGALVR